MKILVLGYHMNYDLEYFTYHNAEALGHEVRFYGYSKRLGRLQNPFRMAITRSRIIRRVSSSFWLGSINDDVRQLALKFKPDLVVVIKGEAFSPRTISWLHTEVGSVTAMWYPDDPRYFNSLVKPNAPFYDHVFTMSRRAIGMYRKIGVHNVDYLPAACETSLHTRVMLNGPEARKYSSDVCFVGGYLPRRARFVSALIRAGIRVSVYGPYWTIFLRSSNVHGPRYGPEMVRLFNAAKIVLNIHVENDLAFKTNMRVYEATGCGSFLLTDRPLTLSETFRDGEDLVCYDDEKHLVELVKYYLSDADSRSRISDSGYAKAQRFETYRQRIKTMLELTSDFHPNQKRN